MNRPILFILFVLVHLSTTVSGMDKTAAAQIFSEAGKAYAEGDYKKAISLYKQAENEFTSFSLEFNLGNAYYKSDSIAAAILHYERARKINPYDEDLKTNLQIANQKVVDKIEALPSLGVTDFWKNLTSESSLKLWSWLMIIFSWLGTGMIALFVWKKNMLYRRALFAGGVFILLLAFCAGGLGQASLNRIRENSEAVVFSPKVDVKGSPSDGGTTVFVIHEGTKVNIRNNRDGWYEIRLANGSVGWMREEQLVVI